MEKCADLYPAPEGPVPPEPDDKTDKSKLTTAHYDRQKWITATRKNIIAKAIDKMKEKPESDFTPTEWIIMILGIDYLEGRLNSTNPISHLFGW